MAAIIPLMIKSTVMVLGIIKSQPQRKRFFRGQLQPPPVLFSKLVYFEVAKTSCISGSSNHKRISTGIDRSHHSRFS